MIAFASESYLSELKIHLGVFIPSALKDGAKPKRELAIKKAYANTYDIQCTAVTIIAEISVSQLLAMNEVVVPHLVEEYAKLNFVLRKLDAALKSMNAFSEVSTAVADIKNALQLKEIPRHLYQDLEAICEAFDVTVDIKKQVDSLKSYQPPPSLLLQMGINS